MVNFWRDEDPRSALNPSNGMLEVPVTNCAGKEEGEEELRKGRKKGRGGVRCSVTNGRVQGGGGRMHYCT